MDTVQGLLELTVYVACVLALSMAMTYVVVKVLPSQSAKEQKAREAES